MIGITQRILREKSHFFGMPASARLLTLSYQLRNIAYPLLSVFTGAFIWRTNNDAVALILYYMGNFLALPLMFVLNRRLLHVLSLRRLYLIGTLISGLGPILVIFHRWQHPMTYLAYGCIYGIGAGLYWANRNFLTIRHTKSTFRSYFTGLQFTLGTISSMIVPVAAGWLIVLTPYGYQILAITAFIILIGSGLVMKNGVFEQPDISRTHRPLSAHWHTARLLSFAIGCVDSVIYILPTVLILHAIGNEAVLGMVSGAVSLLSAMASYIVGRKYRHSQYAFAFVAAALGFALSGIPLFFGLSVFAVSWYLLLANLSDSVVWIVNEPVIMDMMDDEVKRSKTTLARLITEREWYINAGRISVLLLFLAAWIVFPSRAFAFIATVSGILTLAAALPALRRLKHIT